MIPNSPSPFPMKLMRSLLLIIFAAAPLQAAPPNVVVFLADDAGWGDYSFSGNTQLETPNIDSIGKSGVSLDRFYVCPVCSPDRPILAWRCTWQRVGDLAQCTRPANHGGDHAYENDLPDIPTADEAREQMVDGLLDAYRAAIIAHRRAVMRHAELRGAEEALAAAERAYDEARAAWKNAVREAGR